MRFLLALLALFSPGAFAQSLSTNSFPLWPDGAPGALGKEDKDIPTLTPFLPIADKATGAAMVICPGGGYGMLAPHEGQGYAEWLSEHGVTAFVLKYRLGSNGYRHPAMLQDAARAIRTVRSHAEEWKLDPKRIGIIGSSAGGHLTSTLLTHFDAGDPNAKDPIDRVSSRPDLGVLCYAVISFGKFGHQGSKNNLLGKDPNPSLVEELSNELHVTKETPPCFIWHTAADDGVLVEHSLMFAEALRKAGVGFDLHIYEKGAHGLGLGKSEYDPTQLHPWTVDCLYWLKLHHFLQ
jgi:acetyl esterase/lipase